MTSPPHSYPDWMQPESTTNVLLPFRQRPLPPPSTRLRQCENSIFIRAALLVLIYLQDTRRRRPTTRRVKWPDYQLYRSKAPPPVDFKVASAVPEWSFFSPVARFIPFYAQLTFHCHFYILLLFMLLPSRFYRLFSSVKESGGSMQQSFLDMSIFPTTMPLLSFYSKFYFSPFF